MNDERINFKLLCHFTHVIFVLNAEFLIKTDFWMKKEHFLSLFFDYLNFCSIFALEVVKLLVRIV